MDGSSGDTRGRRRRRGLRFRTHLALILGIALALGVAIEWRRHQAVRALLAALPGGVEVSVRPFAPGDDPASPRDFRGAFAGPLRLVRERHAGRPAARALARVVRESAASCDFDSLQGALAGLHWLGPDAIVARDEVRRVATGEAYRVNPDGAQTVERSLAIRILGNLAREHPEIEDDLFGLVSREDRSFRRLISASAAGQFRHDSRRAQEVEATLLRMVEAMPPGREGRSARAAYVVALGRLGWHAEGTQGMLLRIAGDDKEDAGVREAAILGLGNLLALEGTAAERDEFLDEYFRNLGPIAEGENPTLAELTRRSIRWVEFLKKRNARRAEREALIAADRERHGLPRPTTEARR